MLEDHLDVIDMNYRAMLVQHLDKPAHVCAFKVVRQIDCERYRGHGVLGGVRLVSDLNRESQIGHPDAVDRHFPVIGKILGIHKAGYLLRVHRSKVLKLQLPFRSESVKKIAAAFGMGCLVL